MPPEVRSSWYPGAAAMIGTASLLLRYSRSEPGWSPTAGQRALAMTVGLTMLVSNLGFAGTLMDPLLAASAAVAPIHVLFTVLLLLWLAPPLRVPPPLPGGPPSPPPRPPVRR